MGLGAVVLCGGESRRMGSAKAWLPFGPERARHLDRPSDPFLGPVLPSLGQLLPGGLVPVLVVLANLFLDRVGSAHSVYRRKVYR